MSVTYDNSLVANIVSTNSFSTSFTVGSGSNQILLMGIYITNTAVTFPSTPTVDGVNMTAVVSNSGPTGTFGGIFVFSAQNISAGAHTIAFTTGIDTTPKGYTIYSYFGTRGIDTSIATQGTYTSGVPITGSLTSTMNNSLIWSVGAGKDNTSNDPSFSGPSNHTGSGTGVFSAIGAGDFGVQSTPTSETASFGANPGSGQAVVALVSLAGPQIFSIPITSGSYSLIGRSIILTLNKLYTLVVTTGMYALTGFNVLFTYIPYKWKFVSKASVGAWTNVAKAAVPATAMITTVAGSPIGLLLSLTYATTSSIVSGGWSTVKKAVIPNSWTDIPKAM